MAQGVARACTTPPAATPVAAAPSRFSSAVWLSRAGDETVTVTEKESGSERTVVEVVAEQGGNQIIRKRRSRARSPLGTLDLRPWRSPAADVHPAQARRGSREPRSARRVEVAGRAAGRPLGPSTVRAELSRLEEFGLLEHPHTSAGRVPRQRLPALRRRAAGQGPARLCRASRLSSR